MWREYTFFGRKQVWPAVTAFVAAILVPVASGALGRHFVVNLHSDYAGLSEIGFDLADVSSAKRLAALPKGLQGVLWLGNGYNTSCKWRLSDSQVAAEVKLARDVPNFSGIYYISDEPHPATCPDAPDRLAERTALIHSLDPHGRSFIVVEGGALAPGEFQLLADSADLIGLDPYPCNRSNVKAGCDLNQLRIRVMAARNAGIAVDRIVPVFQAFGQSCAGIDKPWYRMPTKEEMVAMLRLWDELDPVNRRPFDMTYSWAPQPGRSCPALKLADGQGWPNLRGVFFNYFAGSGAVGNKHN